MSASSTVGKITKRKKEKEIEKKENGMAWERCRKNDTI